MNNRTAISYFACLKEAAIWSESETAHIECSGRGRTFRDAGFGVNMASIKTGRAVQLAQDIKTSYFERGC